MKPCLGKSCKYIGWVSPLCYNSDLSAILTHGVHPDSYQASPFWRGPGNRGKYEAILRVLLDCFTASSRSVIIASCQARSARTRYTLTVPSFLLARTSSIVAQPGTTKHKNIAIAPTSKSRLTSHPLPSLILSYAQLPRAKWPQRKSSSLRVWTNSAACASRPFVGTGPVPTDAERF